VHRPSTSPDTAPADEATDLPHELALAAEDLGRLVERALQLPEPPASAWRRPGLSPRGERWLEVISSLVLAALAVAWTWSIGEARGMTSGSAGGDGATTPVTRAVTTALTDPSAPSAAYLTQAALQALLPLRGASGKVQVVMRAPGETLSTAAPAGATVTSAIGDSAAGPAAPGEPGIWPLAVKVASAVKQVAGFNVITLTPLEARKKGRIGLYYIGQWPTEGTKARASGATARGDYSPPRGLIEVTRENEDTPLSEHFRLRDFLTHDQQNIWPKYVVVQTRLVDKLELVLADLQARGIPAKGVHVMSGFRTPQYNAGGGDPRGRASLSRHMYGDAADIWIDDDGDGRMDDLDHDGRVNLRDSQVVCDAVERVEREHPELVGGCGVYPANGAHGPFVHVDARGYRARWTGTGDG
jgi:uncharacterized protein YcbK (DUF882 family)